MTEHILVNSDESTEGYLVPQKYFLNTERDYLGVPIREYWNIYCHGQSDIEQDGFIRYDIISVHTPPEHEERVFHTRTYIHPDKSEYKSPKLYCVTRTTFNKLIRK